MPLPTAREATKQCERILEMIEDDVPEAAKEIAPAFFESVEKSVEDVMETIERSQRVTEKQADALDNWEEGVGKWIKNRGETVSDVLSPPYPNEMSTAQSLYRHFGDLRKWVDAQRDEVNVLLTRPPLSEKDGIEQIPLLRELPGDQLYRSLGVGVHFTHLCLLRRIREDWDALLRDYETVWSSTKCVEIRAEILRHAAALVADTSLDNESREARKEQLVKMVARRSKKLNSVIDKMIVDLNDDDEPEEES